MALVTLARPHPAPSPGRSVGQAARRPRPPATGTACPWPRWSAVAAAAARSPTVWSAATHSMTLYGDARAHLDVARHVTDGLDAGTDPARQRVAPASPHAPGPASWPRPLWHSGAAGAIVGGLCFVYTAAAHLLAGGGADRRAACGAWVRVRPCSRQPQPALRPVDRADRAGAAWPSLVGAVFDLCRWMRTLAVRELLWAPLLTVLRHPDPLRGLGAPAAGPLVVVASGPAGRPPAQVAQANLVLFAAIGALRRRAVVPLQPDHLPRPALLPAQRLQRAGDQRGLGPVRSARNQGRIWSRAPSPTDGTWSTSSDRRS